MRWTRTPVRIFGRCGSCAKQGGSHRPRNGQGRGNRHVLLQTTSPGPRKARESGAAPSDGPVAGWTSLKYNREMFAARVSLNEPLAGFLSLIVFTEVKGLQSAIAG